MANQNPDQPSEIVPLGEQPSRGTVPEGQLSGAEARKQAKITLTNIMQYLAEKEAKFQKVPGADDVDSALTAIAFCRTHLEYARGQVKGD